MDKRCRWWTFDSSNALHTGPGVTAWPAWSPDSRPARGDGGKLGGKRYISSLWSSTPMEAPAGNFAAFPAYTDKTPAWFPNGRQVIFRAIEPVRFVTNVNADGSDEHAFNVGIDSQVRLLDARGNLDCSRSRRRDHGGIATHAVAVGITIGAGVGY